MCVRVVHVPNTACCAEMSGPSLSRHQAMEVTPQQLREEEITPVCVCVCVFSKKQRLCIVISNWVNVADCVCIQGCHGLAGFSFNLHTQRNAHRLIWHFFRVLGDQARKLCLPDRQVIMIHKIPTSLRFPLLLHFYGTFAFLVYFSNLEP